MPLSPPAPRLADSPLAARRLSLTPCTPPILRERLLDAGLHDLPRAHRDLRFDLRAEDGVEKTLLLCTAPVADANRLLLAASVIPRERAWVERIACDSVVPEPDAPWWPGTFDGTATRTVWHTPQCDFAELIVTCGGAIALRLIT